MLICNNNILTVAKHFPSKFILPLSFQSKYTNMRITSTIILLLLTMSVFAQHKKDKPAIDSTNNPEGRTLKYGYANAGSDLAVNKKGDTIIRTHSKAPGFSFGLTLSRIDFGLATLVDNKSFTLSPQNQFLRYRSWKTENVGFDVVQFGYRFNSAVRLYMSAGFDWTLIRLRDNITLAEHAPTLSYTQDNIDFSKNRLSSTYLRVPLAFEYRTHDDSDGTPFRFVFGPEGGLLISASQKQVSHQNGTQKFSSDYNLQKFRYGPFVRIGYGLIGVYAKYYMNDIFANSPDQKGLKDLSFGIMLGF